MSASDDYTIDDALHYGFGLLGLYKLWHWNNCIPHGPWHDELDEKMRATQRELDDRYQLLPLDADGEVIHVGDKMAYGDDVFMVCGVGRENGVAAVYYTTEGGYDAYIASVCHHYHKPTVEDVLREFAIACEDADNAGPTVAALIDEYAKRIREAEW